jgi:hypothetical protein
LVKNVEYKILKNLIFEKKASAGMIELVDAASTAENIGQVMKREGSANLSIEISMQAKQTIEEKVPTIKSII